MNDCIFCKIADGTIPANKVYENGDTFVIRDISPQAPVHFLAISKKHYPAIHNIPKDEMNAVMGGLTDAIRAVVDAHKLDNAGYRLVVNSGNAAGQTVPHLHIHILSGRDMTWPPG